MPKKMMDIEEFINEGYLQELNRRFLHPLGLALEASYDHKNEHQPWSLSGVWDCRENPEGIKFKSLDEESVRKHENIQKITKE